MRKKKEKEIKSKYKNDVWVESKEEIENWKEI